MPIYEFERADGKIETRIFTVAEAPRTIRCEDGKMAKRVISAPAFFDLKGSGFPSQTFRRNADMTKRNIKAGERGRKMWKERMPKLVDQR